MKGTLAKRRNPEPMVLNVGITGHRATVLNGPIVRSLQPVIDQVFRDLREAALKIQEDEPAFNSAAPAELRLHTPLASGADQLAARSARSTGYVVRALLPFEADEYRNDFAIGDELDEFEKALDAADEIVALPGDRADPEGAYVLVGKSMIEAADVIVAIWDGEQGRGPGGTAHVVELALQSSVPVIHIDINWGSEEVATRALVGGDFQQPVGISLLGSDAYCGLLRDALKLRADSKKAG